MDKPEQDKPTKAGRWFAFAQVLWFVVYLPFVFYFLAQGEANKALYLMIAGSGGEVVLWSAQAVYSWRLEKGRRHKDGVTA